MSDPHPAIPALAKLHHHYFLGLQLMVSARHGPEVVGDWIFRLFRAQHEAKFLSSFSKLGLDGLPHAVACAKYHVLSNGIGGVAVEYMEESDAKAWVRFRYPRWMFDGPAICGLPIEASRGFLKGWYAQNGVSLGNPRLGFVCVSEDLGAEARGLCGYFKEYDHDLSEEDRLVFAPDERPPAFNPDQQPQPPTDQWSEERLAKAARNYAIEYVRNGLAALKPVIGREETLKIGNEAARLTGLQSYFDMADAAGAADGGPADAAVFLSFMFEGMGDEAACEADRGHFIVRQSSLRVARGLDGEDREDLLSCWIALWRGALASHRRFLTCDVEASGDGLIWRIGEEA